MQSDRYLASVTFAFLHLHLLVDETGPTQCQDSSSKVGLQRRTVNVLSQESQWAYQSLSKEVVVIGTSLQKVLDTYPACFYFTRVCREYIMYLSKNLLLEYYMSIIY